MVGLTLGLTQTSLMQTSQYNMLMMELEAEVPTAFQNFVRMEPAMFREMMLRVGPRIESQKKLFQQATPNGATPGHHSLVPCQQR